MKDRFLKIVKTTPIFVLIFTFLFCLFNFASAEEITDLEIHSPSVLLVDSKTDQILYKKNAEEKMYPASTTKLMTAILVMENCNLTDKVTVTKAAIDKVPVSYATAELRAGETLTVDELLQVLLVPSANDAANVFAYHISGSIEDFAVLMNEKAKELGATNTHFVNPSGVHDEDHYSTAYDMYLIGKKANSFTRIQEIAKQTECSLPNLPDGRERKFKTTNSLIKEDHPYYYEYATGLKTGYTDPAKSCVIAKANKDDRELFCVVLGGEKIDSKSTYRDVDCNTLFEYGYNDLEQQSICKKDEVIDNTKLENIPEILIDSDLVFDTDLNLWVDKNHQPTMSIVWNNEIKRPIQKGTELATVTYLVNGETYSAKILAGEYILDKNVFNYIFIIMMVILGLFILKKILGASKKKRRKKSRR